MREVIALTEHLIEKYLKNNGGNIELFKERLKYFLTNPLWNDDILYQLRNHITKLDLSINEFNSLWKDIENTIDESYSRYLKRKPHIYKEKVREHEKSLIRYFIAFGKMKEQNEILASIIGYIIIHKRLTQEQLKELTNFSKGAISINLRELVKLKAIKKEIIKGTRTYLYTFGENLSEVASNTEIFKSEINEKAREFLGKKIHELNELKDKNGYEILSHRISEIMNYIEIREKILSTITKSTFMKNLREKK